MRHAIFLAPLLLTACAADTAPPQNGEPVAAKPCPVIGGGDWNAWVDAEPGSDGPKLYITGTAEMPTPGYAYSWRVGAADRMMPPGQHMHLEFEAPDGVVAQVITPMEIRYEGKATYPEYRKVVVHCGEKTLAEIDQIMVAE
jgi:hypothetical protein